MRDLSLPAIHQHISVLERADLVSRRKLGRSKILTLNRQSLREAQDWLGRYHTYWGSENETLENYAKYLGAGRELTTSGSNDLSADPSPITGYSILSAESLEEAEKPLEGLPIIDSVRLYEAMSM